MNMMGINKKGHKKYYNNNNDNVDYDDQWKRQRKNA